MKNTMTSKIELPVQAEEGFETKAWVVFTGQTDHGCAFCVPVFVTVLSC